MSDIIRKSPTRPKATIEGSKTARKSAARLAAVQALYQITQREQSVAKVIQEFMDHRVGFPVEDETILVAPEPELFQSIVTGVQEYYDDLSDKLNDHLSENISLTRMEPVLRLILLCGAFELTAHRDIDGPIIISDYVAMTDSFYGEGEKETGLINAVLDAVTDAVR
jgi:N utilization substance protein B